MKRLFDDSGFGLKVCVIVLALVFLIMPVLMAVAMSFDARSFLGPFPPREFSLRWYERFFSDSIFLNGLKVSLVLAVVTTCVSTGIGISAALVVDRYQFRGRDLFASCLLSPLVVPAVVIGFSLLMFFSSVGVFDGFTRLLGGHIIITVPYVVRATLAGLVGIRPSLTEAALSLGANERQAFWRVTFPLARTGIVAGAVFAFAFSLDDVAVSLFLIDRGTVTLPVALVSMMRANFDLTIAAASVLLMVFTLVLIFVLDRVVGLDTIVGQGIYRA